MKINKEDTTLYLIIEEWMFSWIIWMLLNLWLSCYQKLNNVKTGILIERPVLEGGITRYMYEFGVQFIQSLSSY